MAQQREGYDEALLRITGQYVEEVQAGHQPRLGDYVLRYPHYAEAIAEFVAYYHTFEVQLTATEDENVGSELMHLSPSTQAALQIARKRVSTDSQRRSSQAITTLFKTGEDEQLLLEQMAHQLNLSKDVVMLLEQRRLQAGSIPLALQRRLALWLKQPVSSVQYFFRIASNESSMQPYEPGTRVAEKQLIYAKDAPKSFLQALEESDEATEEQKTFWRACVAEEQQKAE